MGSRVLDDAEVFELPRIVAVEVLGEKLAAILQGGPSTVLAVEFTEVGLSDFQDIVVIQIFRFDNPKRRIFYRVHKPRERSNSYLERSCVVVWHKPARFFDREIGA